MRNSVYGKLLIWSPFAIAVPDICITGLKKYPKL